MARESGDTAEMLRIAEEEKENAKRLKSILVPFAFDGGLRNKSVKYDHFYISFQNQVLC